jgi:LPXTG-motif cell wall-anchored protein
MVRVIAKPEVGYRFVNWAGDVDTIANVRAATTVITMHGNYAITANFAVNWLLIGGIIVAVVAAGLAIFFVRRRRAARTERQGRRRAARKKH